MAAGNIDLIVRRALLTAAMLGVLLPLLDNFRGFLRKPKPVAIEAHYGAIAAAIPPQAAIGYISDVPAPGPGVGMFLQAQYGVAPRLLRVGGVHRFTLANLQDPAKLQGICRENGFALEQSGPPGVALLRPMRAK